MRHSLKKLLRIPLFPILRYFGPRFHQVHLKLDQTNHHVQRLANSQDALLASVSVDLQTTIEFANNLQKTAMALSGTVARLEEIIRQDLGRKLLEEDPVLRDYAAGLLIGTRLKDLGPGAAQLLNWASQGGAQGCQEQAGLWFNPTLALHHEPGGIKPVFVNERILEVPYALAAAGKLEINSAVMDVGSNESLVALSLASMGLKVLAVDPRGYPLSHPNLEVVTESIEKWAGPTEGLDAIFCVSTLEHLGVGAYDQEEADLDLDRLVMERFRSWLKPGGELVFTAPYGKWDVSDFQRIYDKAHLEALFKGWTVTDRQVYFHASDFFWERLIDEPTSEFWEGKSPGVTLIRATPEA